MLFPFAWKQRENFTQPLKYPRYRLGMWFFAYLQNFTFYTIAAEMIYIKQKIWKKVLVLARYLLYFLQRHRAYKSARGPWPGTSSNRQVPNCISKCISWKRRRKECQMKWNNLKSMDLRPLSRCLCFWGSSGRRYLFYPRRNRWAALESIPPPRCDLNWYCGRVPDEPLYASAWENI